MRTAFALTAGFLAVAVTTQAGPGDAKPDIRGTIAQRSIGKKKDLLGVIFVEGTLEKGGSSSDKAWVRITTETKIEKQVGKVRRTATYDDLKVGGRVHIHFLGFVPGTEPLSATAKSILILEGK